MDEQAKQRAVGAVVIVGLAIIFVPLILDFGADKREPPIEIVIPQQSTDPTTISIPLDQHEQRTASAVVPTEPPVLSETPIVPAAEPSMPATAQVVAPMGNGDAEAVGGGPVPDSSASSMARPSVSEKQASQKALAPTTKPDSSKVVKVDPKPNAPVTGARAWAVQVASFSERKSAEALRARLQKKGYRAFLVSSSLDNRVTVRVRIGPELLRADADRIRNEVERDFKLQAMVVRHR